MWVKVDDDLINHPKMFAAGRHLGKRGRMRAFTVYMAGLSWTNRHLTNGFIAEEAVDSFVIDERPKDVADVLTFPDVKLWHKVPGGFQIHDYHDHNPTADEVKEKLKRDRERKRSRRKSDENPSGHPIGVHADSRALARARIPSPPLPSLSEDHRGCRREALEAVDNPRVLKALVWREVIAAYDDPAESWSIADLAERLKAVAARARLTYGGDFFNQQLERAMERVERRRGARAA